MCIRDRCRGRPPDTDTAQQLPALTVADTKAPVLLGDQEQGVIAVAGVRNVREDMVPHPKPDRVLHLCHWWELRGATEEGLHFDRAEERGKVRKQDLIRSELVGQDNDLLHHAY